MSNQYTVVELVTPTEAKLYERINNIQPFTQQKTVQKITVHETPRNANIPNNTTNNENCCVVS